MTNEGLGKAIGQASVRGARRVFWINAITLPMSFLINIVLGRTSSYVLGLYGAVQIAIAAFQTFFILGGNVVFTRFVPGLPRDRRLPFLASYVGLVLTLFSTVALLLISASPGTVQATLARFGSPSPLLAYGIGATVIVWAFASHFLYSVERPTGAAIALKFIVLGYFALVLFCLTPPGRRLLETPERTLWTATAVIYLVAAALAVTLVARVDASIVERRLAWFLPAGFWSAVLYTHLGTVVEFVYNSLSPSVVVLWLDIESLGWLTAALRWVVLLATVPAMLVSVVAPGLARLEASGLRDEALRQARSALRAFDLFVVPSVLALVLVAPLFMGVFGPAYRDYASLLRLSALSALSGPIVFLGGGLAVAFGALRAYLSASLVFVAAGLILNLTLVPTLGLPGAAIATTLSTGCHVLAVTWVTRGLGFRPPRTTFLGWIAAAIALLAASAFELTTPVAVLAWLALSAGFTWSAGASWGELKLLVSRLVGRGA